MYEAPSISFNKIAAPKQTILMVLALEGRVLGSETNALDPSGALPRAFAAADFNAKLGGTLDILTPAGTAFDRIVALGAGKADALDEAAWTRLGGIAAGQIKKAGDIAVVLELAGRSVSGVEAAAFSLGFLLRSYGFTKYKTKKDSSEDGEPTPQARKVVIHCAEFLAARKAFVAASAAAAGVTLARDLVNEPANKLGPIEFAARAKDLEALGVTVEILAEPEMERLGMGALLGVAQGSPRGARLAVMQWNGGKAGSKPIAFVGKGVTFDTGGNSMKPAAGMEDMKGDMGGAAAVLGLMHTLAARKARTNVIGVIGLVENAVDGLAQRPGDIVTSMSGQTIEVLNTDAEGRLVLSDALWYTNDRFQPVFMVNLATLTGAIMVALGQQHAGLFANNDELAARLLSAGLATTEKLWRMPLGPDYDKLIDSKTADMKNIGGRYGGAITAAQFLQRFVKDTPWAHLDIAGTAMGSPASDINQSWGSGFGVRLLDRLVKDHYEA